MELGKMMVVVGAKIDEFTKNIDVVQTKTEQMKQQSGGVASFMEQNWLKVGAAAATAGIALEGLARSQAPLTEQTKQLAASLEMTEKEMRGLAIEVSNVTFPLNEVLDVMEKGRQQGIKSAEQLAEYATFWDTVGDATGESAARLAEAGSALRAVGIDAGNEAEAMSAFGFVTQETTSDVGEFLSFLERTGPQLRELGMDVDDAAAMLGVLEHEFGMAGRTARSEFRKAVNEADGDLNTMMKTLGVTESQFESYRAKVAESSDVIQRNADIHAESYTMLQKLQHQLSETTYAMGGLIGSAADLAPLMMVTGPLMKGIAFATKTLPGMAKGLLAAAAAKVKLSLALLASPIGLIVVAIGLLVAAGVLLYKNWDKIRDVMVRAINGIVNAFNKLIDVINKIPGVNFGKIGSVGTTQGTSAYDFPGMAGGGTTTTPGMAMVGEQGPELLNLPAGAKVTPLQGGDGPPSLGGKLAMIIADDQTLKKLWRQMQGARQSETARGGAF